MIPYIGIASTLTLRKLVHGALAALGEGKRPNWSRRPPLSREDVFEAFNRLLDRDPESEEAVEFFRSMDSLGAAYATIAKSPEYTGKPTSSPFFHFNATIDPYPILRSHANPDRRAMPGHIVNFLGVAMNAKFMPHLAEQAGTVEGLPIPINFHADIAEWAAALRAVDLAKESFTVLELGCGWGCWMTNTVVAARRRGLATCALGVEGDTSYVEFAKEALATNGVAPRQFEIRRGVAAAAPGIALFPKKAGKAGTQWGFEPVLDASVQERESALDSGRYEEVPHVTLSDAIGERRRIDLLHMDIQGGEANLVRDCLQLLADRVAYLVIGTHSRLIEGQIIEALVAAGWRLEIERPAILGFNEKGPYVTADGVQGWRNPSLIP